MYLCEFIVLKDVMEIQKDSIMAGQNVIVTDDLLATGGMAIIVWSSELYYCVYSSEKYILTSES